MLAWYIGAGTGEGSPYGIAAITIVILGPILFAKMAAPASQVTIWLMTGVMIVFVVGYSWIDSHLHTVANPGIGANLAWHRALLVMIGFTASFVVMLFPTPTSARQAVRRTIARTHDEITNTFAAEIETCILQAATHQTKEGGHADVRRRESRRKTVSERLLATAGRLQKLAPSLATAQYEPTFKGPWPAEKYQRLHTLHSRLILSLALLNGACIKLDGVWLDVLIHKTPFLNPNLLFDIVSTNHLASEALRHSKRIPGSLPTLRDRLIYHARHSAAYGGGDNSLVPNMDDAGRVSAEKTMENASLDVRTLSALRDDHLPGFSTAVIALGSIIEAFDDIADIVRDLCGTTTTFSQLNTLRDEYLRMEEMTIRNV